MFLQCEKRDLKKSHTLLGFSKWSREQTLQKVYLVGNPTTYLSKIDKTGFLCV